MNGSQFHDCNWLDDPLGGVSAPGSIPGITPGSALISGIRDDITSWAELAALITVGANLPVIIEWYDTTEELTRITRAEVGTDATNTAIGVQRADDWADSGAVWYQTGIAG